MKIYISLKQVLNYLNLLINIYILNLLIIKTFYRVVKCRSSSCRQSDKNCRGNFAINETWYRQRHKISSRKMQRHKPHAFLFSFKEEPLELIEDQENN